MADGYALGTSALLAIFCASLCLLTMASSLIITMVHNLERLFFSHEYFSEQMSMLECSLSFHVVAFEKLGGSIVQSFSRGILNTTQLLPVLLIQLFI